MKNACKMVNENLRAYLDKEIIQEQNVLIQEHLAVCVDCQKTVEAFRFVMRAAKSIEHPEVPPALTDKIKKRIQEVRDERRETFLLTAMNALAPLIRLRFAMASFAVVCIIIMAYYSFTLRNAPETASVPVTEDLVVETATQSAILTIMTGI